MFLWGSSLQVKFIKFSPLHEIKATNVAIIVPEEEKFMKKYGKGRSFQDACADADTTAKFLAAINEFAREDGVKGYEIPKAIYLEHEPFSVRSNAFKSVFILLRLKMSCLLRP